MASIKKYYLKKSKDYRYEVYVSNGIDPGTKLQRKINKKGFKSFEEAFKEAKRLNELPKNKKRAKDWNNAKAFFTRKCLEGMLGE